VRELAQADGARHARAALERVQRTLHCIGAGAVLGIGAPGAQVAHDLRHQLVRFLEEHRQQRAVEVVAHRALVLGPRRHEQAVHERLQRGGHFGCRRGRFAAADDSQHFGDFFDRRADRLPVGGLDGALSERHPLLERSSDLRNRVDARGTRGARKGMGGAGERGGGLRRLASRKRGEFALQRGEMLGGFLEIDIAHARDGRVFAGEPGGELADRAGVDHQSLAGA
jgi:hypothetical protein